MYKNSNAHATHFACTMVKNYIDIKEKLCTQQEYESEF